MRAERKEVHGPERLRVYHLALDFARQADALLARTRGRPRLVDQLQRAADSIVLNIAEGAAHFKAGKKLYHYQIAHASAGECIGALARLKDTNPHLDTQRAHRTAHMVSSLLMSLIKTQQLRKET